MKRNGVMVHMEVMLLDLAFEKWRKDFHNAIERSMMNELLWNEVDK